MTRDEIRTALRHEVQRDVYPVRRPVGTCAACGDAVTLTGRNASCPCGATRVPAAFFQVNERMGPRPVDTGREHHPGTLAGHLRFAAWTGRPLQPIVRGLPHNEP